jgi:hypothetical protein
MKNKSITFRQYSGKYILSLLLSFLAAKQTLRFSSIETTGVILQVFVHTGDYTATQCGKYSPLLGNSAPDPSNFCLYH